MKIKASGESHYRSSRVLLAVLLTILEITLLLCVKPISVKSESGSIDLFTQKGGEGINQSGGAFEPQELVILYANVTYNSVPLAQIVGFAVYDPANTMFALGADSTDQNGIAQWSFRIPPENVEGIFGTWFAVATVNINDQTVMDTLTFQVSRDVNGGGGSRMPYAD
jgi:hypothetical protein